MDAILIREDANYTSMHFNMDIKLYLKGFMYIQLYESCL